MREGAVPHAECWDLLPWLVTARLSDADRAMVEAHLNGCLACREELVAQRRLRERMSSHERVSYSPAASFEKLWSRIEELEREVPVASSTNEQHVAPPADMHKQIRSSHVAQLSRWLVAAVIVQSIALAWLAISLIPRTSGEEWSFRTVTSSPSSSAAAPAIRVVFAPDVTLVELQYILAAHGLVIAHGSPASEAVVLVPVTGGASADVTTILKRLRADRRVRFAELTAGEAAR